MKKKITLILITLIMLFTLSGCEIFAVLFEAVDEDEYIDNYTTTPVYINETLTNRYGIQFTVYEVQNGAHLIGKNGGSIESTDYNFVLIKIRIYNGSNKDFYVNPYNFRLIRNDNGNEVGYDYDSRTIYFENNMSSSDLKPLFTQEYTILFEVPEKTTEMEYYLHCKAESLVVDPPKDAVDNIILKNR